MNRRDVLKASLGSLIAAPLVFGREVEAVYTQKRLYRSLGYLPPTEFEQAYKMNRDKNQTITP